MAELLLKAFSRVPNVGDLFSSVLAKRYFSSEVVVVDETPLSVGNLVFLGSIMGYADRHSIVCGAGLLDTGKIRYPPASVVLTRGPLSRFHLAQQGIDSAPLFGDPGVLFSCVYPVSRSSEFPVGVVPHYVDIDSEWVRRARESGCLVLDPRIDPEEFASQIQRCDAILSSSLHGIIFAHSFGIPAAWIELSDRVVGHGFKFFDYFASCGVKPENVDRIRVEPSDSPLSLAERAFVCSQNLLVQSVLQGVSKAKALLGYQL